MKTKQHIARLGFALLALAAAGCASTNHGASESPVPRGHGLASPEKPAYTVSEKAEMMKIGLSVSPADEASAAFAEGVRETVVTALRDRKFQLVTDGSEDLSLSFRAGQSLYDETAGEYFSLDGEVSARLDDTPTKKVLAEKTFRGRNKASLGMAKATVDLSEAMRPEIRKWIEQTVTPEQVPLEVRTLRVSRIDRYPGGESAFIDAFVKAVSGMKGVLRCETAGLDGLAKVASFRVLYRRADYPQGFIHAVINQNPSFRLVLQ